MYQVLYRKYRPQQFSDVVGQPQVTVTLKNEVMRGRIAHAYLFTGSRGTGKTTCARILAKAVNCLHPKDGDPCRECEICRGLEEGSILDVEEIDAASNNGVSDVRSLIESSNFTPATAKYRVYIIDEVHMLSPQALNALLKTLEEPPPHVIFILATTEVHKLLPTILSRCQRFDFKRIAPEAIADRLEYVAQQEGAQLDREAGLLIARIADGALRDALSLFDQCLGRDRHVTLEIVNQTAGLAGREYLTSLAQNVADHEIPQALETIDNLHRNSKDMGRLCEELAEYFRGLMLIKTMKDASQLVVCSASEMEAMTAQALAMSLPTILHGLDTFEDALNKMRYSDPRSQLEMAFVKLCSPELDTTPEALLRRLEALESGQALMRPVASTEDGQEASSGTASAKETKESKKGASAKTSEENKPTAAELSAGAQRLREWPEVLQRFQSGSKSVEKAFENSKAYVNGNFVLIQASDLAMDLLRHTDHQRNIKQALKRAITQVLGRPCSVGPYVEPKKEEDRGDPLEELERRAREEGVEIQEEVTPPPQEEDELPPLPDEQIPF
ncbi:MAG: DNA polymerase III subunit gamma/tau [Acutalibacter sp.]